MLDMMALCSVREAGQMLAIGYSQYCAAGAELDANNRQYSRVDNPEMQLVQNQTSVVFTKEW